MPKRKQTGKVSENAGGSSRQQRGQSKLQLGPPASKLTRSMESEKDAYFGELWNLTRSLIFTKGQQSSIKNVEDPKSLRDTLKSNYLVEFPDEFFAFWSEIKGLTPEDENPCDAFRHVKDLRLVGVFEYLAGQLQGPQCSDGSFFLKHRRYATDLPEMQTIAVGHFGRYAYWRDAPETKDPLIVFVPSSVEHFVHLEIVGRSDPRRMIVHYLGANSGKHGLTLSQEWLELYKSYSKELEKLVAERRKTSLGQPFHGLGIVVTVKDDIGYRPIPRSQANLRKLLTTIATTEDTDLRDAQMKNLMEIYSFVQFANDELDYGMGLEFGHDLFCSNFERFDKMAKSVLSVVYGLLERDAFAQILEATTDERRAIPSA